MRTSRAPRKSIRRNLVSRSDLGRFRGRTRAETMIAAAPMGSCDEARGQGKRNGREEGGKERTLIQKHQRQVRCCEKAEPITGPAPLARAMTAPTMP